MSQNKPLMIELFAGLHGWGEGAVAEGYRVVGYDIVDMCELLGLPRPKGIELILRDVRSITGEECKDAAVIVASPPCQAYSYRAMPWKRAKALPPPDNTLFNECFRIQREASEAAGHYIPLIVENVRGAQKWVGRARWHYCSFYLWGDVPALMPITLGGVMKEGVAHRSNGETNFHGSTARAGLKAGWDNREYGKCRRADGRNRASDPRRSHGNSDSRKAASAMIAKIPYPLAQHIARCFYPAEVQP